MSKGVDSIRIKGRKIEDLPLGLGNEAKAQLPEAIAAERLQHIAEINAEFPAHRIDYLNSRVNECNENKVRMDTTIAQQNTMISDYKGHIAMSKHRDKELAKFMDDPQWSEWEIKEKRKALFKQFLPYKIDALEQQIVQCGEAIDRCIDVKKKEDASIIEFTEVVALCRQRDRALAEYGAVAEG
jgi:hypothetical protein